MVRLQLPIVMELQVLSMQPWRNTIQLPKSLKSIPILVSRLVAWRMQVTLSSVLTVKHSLMEQISLGNKGQELIHQRQVLNKLLPISNIQMVEAKMLL
ncbi:hypothetical protein DXN33_08580 [Streptococcus sp. NM]|nr:hypothetical protein DXN33_08580 [Streptococcus sp. NM]